MKLGRTTPDHAGGVASGKCSSGVRGGRGAGAGGALGDFAAGGETAEAIGSCGLPGDIAGGPAASSACRLNSKPGGALPMDTLRSFKVGRAAGLLIGPTTGSACEGATFGLTDVAGVRWLGSGIDLVIQVKRIGHGASGVIPAGEY